MKLYTETTDGSAIETKESALVWNYQYADPDFGSCQAKELLDHLESVLANEPVSVKSGQHIVEVKPQVSAYWYYNFTFIFCMEVLGPKNVDIIGSFYFISFFFNLIYINNLSFKECKY